MAESILFLLLIAVWIVAQTWLLPRLGVPT